MKGNGVVKELTEVEMSAKYWQEINRETNQRITKAITTKDNLENK